MALQRVQKRKRSRVALAADTSALDKERYDGELTLAEFFANDIPPYAILSHAWGADHEEVSFQDVVGGTAKGKLGYRKIQSCGKQASVDGLQYFWVDTCCIDKTSSAELSEALNSMFQWYALSKCCYAYLADIYAWDDIGQSRWFTRGWTLQELIAPTKLAFYSAEWEFIGFKSDINLQDLFLDASGIPVGQRDALDQFRAEDWTIAQRMSWASNRNTKRVEDIAYCLLGIFNVNMPLLYGEGDRAFLRLQEEIIKTSEDHSIFACTDLELLCGSFCGLLARSPAQFAHSHILPNSIWSPSPDMFSDGESRVPYSMTNQGIRIQLYLIPIDSSDPGMYFAPLGYREDGGSGPAIVLKRLTQNEFTRTQPHLLVTGKLRYHIHYSRIDSIRHLFTDARKETIFVKQRDPVFKPQNRTGRPMFWIQYSQILHAGFSPSRSWPRSTTYSTSPRLESRVTRDSSTSIILEPILPMERTLRFWGDIRGGFKLTIENSGSCQLESSYKSELPYFSFESTEMSPTNAKLVLVGDPRYETLLVISARSTVESNGNGGLYSIVLDACILNSYTKVSERWIVELLGSLSAASGLALAYQHWWEPSSLSTKILASSIFAAVSWRYWLVENSNSENDDGASEDEDNSSRVSSIT